MLIQLSAILVGAKLLLGLVHQLTLLALGPVVRPALFVTVEHGGATFVSHQTALGILLSAYTQALP